MTPALAIGALQQLHEVAVKSGHVRLIPDVAGLIEALNWLLEQQSPIPTKPGVPYAIVRVAEWVESGGNGGRLQANDVALLLTYAGTLG